LSAEGILAKTRADTLSDEPSDVLKVMTTITIIMLTMKVTVNEPEIARKMKKN
jgi:hypothetical protein